MSYKRKIRRNARKGRRMKYIKFVRVEKDADLTHQGFLLEVTNAGEFIDHKPGVEGLELALKTRASIAAQAKEAYARGYWEFEDAHADAFKIAIAKIKWNPARAEKLVPFAKASSAILDEKPESPVSLVPPPSEAASS